MKIAILISGRINSTNKIYENIRKNIVKSNDVDFFIICEKKTDDEVISEVCKLYHPKLIVKSDENVNIDVSTYKTMPETNRMNVMYMYLSRNYLKVYLNKYVKDTRINYDAIIHTRMDAFLDNDIDMNKLMPYVNINMLCIPNQNMDHYNGVCDLFAIGNLTTMSIYLDLYNSIYGFMEKQILLHPEILLYHHLKSSSLEIYRFVLELSRLNFNDDTITWSSFVTIPNVVNASVIDARFVRFKQNTRKPLIKLIM
jgi:hypothetical protein